MLDWTGDGGTGAGSVEGLLGLFHGVRVREAFLRRSGPSFQLQSPVPTSGIGVALLVAATEAAAEEACTEDTDED